MSIAIGPYTLGEIPSPFTYTFLDSSGAAIDLSAGYSADFCCQEHDSPPVTGAAAVSNAAAGQVTYTWAGTEFPTAGRYTAYFWTGNGTNRFASQPIIFTVQLSSGPVPPL